MATWEDGPEYAPHERPQYFADAPVPPLEQAPPVARPADGLPATRPRFDQPSVPVAPLATLVPEPPDERDPHRPFDILTTTLTSESAWGPTGSAPGTAPLTPTQPFVPSALAPVPVPPGATGPTGELAQQAQPGPQGQEGPPPQDPYAYPAPGTPSWFAPPPATYGDQQRPGRVNAKQVVEAATPGLCICLALGGLVIPLAPVLVIVAVFLSTRVRVAQRAVRIAFRSAAGAVGFFAVVGLFRSVVDGDPWWSYVRGWSAGICWIMLGVLLLVVWQALTRPNPPVPPTPNPWG
ncbi:MAG: hypothetical protein ACRYG2_25740 [Janthinobacterium lividum]